MLIVVILWIARGLVHHPGSSSATLSRCGSVKMAPSCKNRGSSRCDRSLLRRGNILRLDLGANRSCLFLCCHHHWCAKTLDSNRRHTATDRRNQERSGIEIESGARPDTRSMDSTFTTYEVRRPSDHVIVACNDSHRRTISTYDTNDRFRGLIG